MNQETGNQDTVAGPLRGRHHPARNLQDTPTALRLAGFSLAALLGWSGGAASHCDPPKGHFDCASTAEPQPNDPIPVPGTRLLANVINERQAMGANRTRIKSELVNQRYSNGAQQRYLLVDAMVRLPYPAIGVTNKAQAQAARLTLRYYRAGVINAYAECTLEPRQIVGRWATYSLGLKANAAQTMLRWGICDDPQTPGHDSEFPYALEADIAKLEGPGGVTIAQFAPPLSVDVPQPARNRRQPQPVTARLMEGGSYRITK